MLEFAAILGEAIARAHLSGKPVETRNENAPADDGRGINACVPSMNGEILEHEHFTTNRFPVSGGH